MNPCWSLCVLVHVRMPVAKAIVIAVCMWHCWSQGLAVEAGACLQGGYAQCSIKNGGQTWSCALQQDSVGGCHYGGDGTASPLGPIALPHLHYDDGSNGGDSGAVHLVLLCRVETNFLTWK